MQDMIEAKLAAADYRHGEISAYAKPGRESRHSLNYWRFGDYIGIVAGAHGKFPIPTASPRDALQAAPDVHRACRCRI